MKAEVLVLIICDETVERQQKYEACTLIEKRVQRIRGIESTSYTGNDDADITAFANWERNEIPNCVEELKKIDGIKKITTKILVPV